MAWDGDSETPPTPNIPVDTACVKSSPQMSTWLRVRRSGGWLCPSAHRVISDEQVPSLGKEKSPRSLQPSLED